MDGEDTTLGEATESAGAQAVPTPVPTPTVAETIDAAIRRWMVERIHNSPVAQATDGFNHLTASLPALRDEIVRSI